MRADGSFKYEASRTVPTGTYVVFYYKVTDGSCVSAQTYAKIQVSCKCHAVAPSPPCYCMGVTLDETSLTFAMMFGSLIISIPILMFFARRSTNLEFKKGVIYCASVYLFVSTIILLITQIKGLMNSLGWSIVLLHFAFFLWFGYYALTLKTSHSE